MVSVCLIKNYNHLFQFQEFNLHTNIYMMPVKKVSQLDKTRILSKLQNIYNQESADKIQDLTETQLYRILKWYTKINSGKLINRVQMESVLYDDFEIKNCPDSIRERILWNFNSLRCELFTVNDFIGLVRKLLFCEAEEDKMNFIFKVYNLSETKTFGVNGEEIGTICARDIGTLLEATIDERYADEALDVLHPVDNVMTDESITKEKITEWLHATVFYLIHPEKRTTAKMTNLKWNDYDIDFKTFSSLTQRHPILLELFGQVFPTEQAKNEILDKINLPFQHYPLWRSLHLNCNLRH